MPRQSRENRPVSEELDALKGDLDELLETVTKWQGGNEDETEMLYLADEIQISFLLFPRSLLKTALKFHRLEEARLSKLRRRNEESQRKVKE
jgi:hypothetical protein